MGRTSSEIRRERNRYRVRAEGLVEEAAHTLARMPRALATYEDHVIRDRLNQEAENLLDMIEGLGLSD